MRLLIILFLVVALLGGGGAGAYFYFMKQAEASVGEDGEVMAEAEVVKEEKPVDRSKFELVEFDPFFVPIVDENGVNQVISLIVALEVTDSKAATEVEMYTPRLKSAFIQDMYGALSRKATLEGGVMKVSSIKKRLNTVSDKVLGEDVVQGVLLQVVQQRPI